MEQFYVLLTRVSQKNDARCCECRILGHMKLRKCIQIVCRSPENRSEDVSKRPWGMACRFSEQGCTAGGYLVNRRYLLTPGLSEEWA